MNAVNEGNDSGPTLVSLFAGAGGLDAGLEMAGFRTVLAIDIDPDAIATLKANQEARIRPPGANWPFLQGATLLRGDLTKMTKSQLREAWGRQGPPTVLAGGPPCQSFSSAGRMRGLDDARGRLFLDFVRAARALQPEFVIFENVQGLVTARDADGVVGGVLGAVRERFETAGYACSFAVVNAADYGAAQRRVRLVMLGTRRHRLPVLEAPTHHRDPAGAGVIAWPWVTLEQALRDVAPPTSEEQIRPSHALQRKLETVAIGEGIRTGGHVEANRPSGHWGYRQDGFVADPSLPARTVRAASTPDWLRLPDGSHRRLSWRECARLQGFPSGWRFEGAMSSVYRQIGNAVPLELGLALGRAVRHSLDQGALPRGRRAASADWPPEIRRRIRYTRAEQRVNGPAREARKLLPA